MRASAQNSFQTATGSETGAFTSSGTYASLSPYRSDHRCLCFSPICSQVEDVESDAAAVDLCEDVADLVEPEILIQLYVRNLILLGDASQMLTEGAGVLRVPRGPPGINVVAVSARNGAPKIW